MRIISRYTITKPDFRHIINILKSYVLEYNEKFTFYLIIYKWKLHFSDTINIVESPTCSSIYNPDYLRDLLLSKINYFERYGGKFSHISEMSITFISDLRNVTYEQYLTIPKPMIEWRFNILLSRNPDL